MKKYLIALSAFTVITVAANAQTNNNSTNASGQHSVTHMHHKKSGKGMHKHHKNAMMMKKLNLTDAQKQQVKALNTDYKKHLKDLKKDKNTITLTAYRTKKANLQKERKSKFKALLTPDQKNKMAQIKKARSEKNAMIAQKKMKTALNLTDAQVAKIEGQRASFKTQAKAIRENSSLTNEQKKEQLKNLMKSNKESMNNILTAKQLKEKEELRNKRISDMKNKKANKDS